MRFIIAGGGTGGHVFPGIALAEEIVGRHPAHDAVFVVEQNRDGQLRTLLVNELEIDPARLRKILHFDGTPITARFIAAAITKQVHELAVSPVGAKA